MSPCTKYLLISMLTTHIGAVNPSARADSLPDVNQKVRLVLDEAGTTKVDGFVGGIRGDSLYLCDRGEIRIDGIVTTDNVTHEFVLTGGTYDGSTRVVTGLTSSGDSVCVSLSDVSYATVTLSPNNKPTPITFGAQTIHARLRHSVAYPSVTWQGPLDSIHTMKVWHQQNTTAIVLSALAGLSVGFLSSWKNAEDPERTWENMFALSRNGQIFLASAVGFVFGTTLGWRVFGGHWVEQPLEGSRIVVRPATNNGPGLSFSIGL